MVGRVRMKIEDYLHNLSTAIAGVTNEENTQAKIDQACKGLPRRYHVFVQQIVARVRQDERGHVHRA